MKRFHFHTTCYLRERNYDWCDFEQLSLDKLACLDMPFFKCLGVLHSFDLKALPDSYDLYFSAPHELSGQLSSKLESLYLNLVEYDESFESFWKKFIFPLKNLFCLKVVLSEDPVIGFRKLQFPKRLNTIELSRSFASHTYIFESTSSFSS
ncbi:unnamed protein product [Ambrosiozyma monospora]|uniref:Unnamed protein product n=1 Tax=Ambrosiozyma monospora TaxID=43982 RepID=A0ACB5T8Q3_AMBMO|nr:unnamed protein product [Ambrosiozyma monospora]